MKLPLLFEQIYVVIIQKRRIYKLCVLVYIPYFFDSYFLIFLHLRNVIIFVFNVDKGIKNTFYNHAFLFNVQIKWFATINKHLKHELYFCIIINFVIVFQFVYPQNIIK